MVLPMDLTATDKHPELVQTVLQQFGRVSYQFTISICDCFLLSNPLLKCKSQRVCVRIQ